MEVVNRNPTFGSPLLSDNFGRRPTEDDMEALDPLHLEADGVVASEGASKDVRASESGKSNSPQLQNPEGATQMFNPVAEAENGGGATDIQADGINPVAEAENGGGATDIQADGRVGMRVMAGRVTVGAERAGVTDWHTGTDGGKSSKPRIGVPYGSFAGV